MLSSLDAFCIIRTYTESLDWLELLQNCTCTNTDIFSYLAKDFRENKNLTCRKCTTHVLSIFRHKLPRNEQYSIDTNQKV